MSDNHCTVSPNSVGYPPAALCPGTLSKRRAVWIPVDLMTTRIISSCTDKEMRTKLLEMKPAVESKPTIEELEKVVANYEAQKISEDLLKGEVPISFHFISYTLFHIQDIKKDMRITNCMIYLALSWKRLMIFVIQFQKKNIMCFKGDEYNKMLKKDCH